MDHLECVEDDDDDDHPRSSALLVLKTIMKRENTKVTRAIYFLSYVCFPVDLRFEMSPFVVLCFARNSNGRQTREEKGYPLIMSLLILEQTKKASSALTHTRRVNTRTPLGRVQLSLSYEKERESESEKSETSIGE